MCQPFARLIVGPPSTLRRIIEISQPLVRRAVLLSLLSLASVFLVSALGTEYLSRGRVPDAKLHPQQPELLARAVADCRISTTAQTTVMLPNGRSITVDPQSALASPGALIAVGSHAHLWPADSERQAIIDEGSIIGFISDSAGTRAVRSPIPGKRILYPRVVANAGGHWEMIFITTASTGLEEPEVLDAGTIWYGRYDGRNWRDVARVSDVRHAALHADLSSALIRTGRVLNFAYSFEGSVSTQTARSSGVVLMRRIDGYWRSETLWTSRRPTYVRLAEGNGESIFVGIVRSYVANQRAHASSLFVRLFDSTWHEAHLIAEHADTPLYKPALRHFGNGVIAAWATRPLDGSAPRLESATLSLSHFVPMRTVLATGAGAEDYDGVVLGNRKVVWLSRNGNSRTLVRAVMQMGDSTVSLGSVSVPLDSPSPAAVADSDSSFVLITTRLGRSPGERAATYISRLLLRCSA